VSAKRQRATWKPAPTLPAGGARAGLDPHHVAAEQLDRAGQYIPGLANGLVSRLRSMLDRAVDHVFGRWREIDEALPDRGDSSAQDQRGAAEEPALLPVDLRTAAYVLAASRVARVAQERGVWP
jgi:hypothetical protein